MLAVTNMFQLRPKPLAGFEIDLPVHVTSAPQTPCGIHRHRPCGFLESSLDITNLSIIHIVLLTSAADLWLCPCL